MADNPQDVAFASAEQLGRLTGTSDATVIRTVKSLGYSGLPTLKRALQDALRERLTPAGRLTHSLDAIGGDLDHVYDLVASEQIELLQESRRSIAPGEFRKAVAAIRAADHLLTCAVGIPGQLAEYFTSCMLRQGRHARTVHASGLLFADALVPLTAGDAVVLVSHHEVKPEDEVVLEHADRVGARVILITDSLGSVLTDRVDAVLSAPTDNLSAQTDRNGTVGSINVTLTVLDALALALAVEQREKVSSAMGRLGTVRSRLSEVTENVGSASRRRRQRPAAVD
jgi:DNA-binding MurR/RpiR family transcriptional regulator